MKYFFGIALKISVYTIRDKFQVMWIDQLNGFDFDWTYPFSTPSNWA